MKGEGSEPSLTCSNIRSRNIVASVDNAMKSTQEHRYELPERTQRNDTKKNSTFIGKALRRWVNKSKLEF